MKINGMEATHIGFVGFFSLWEANEMDIFDDLWRTPDGKRYVERYIQGDVVEYNWMKHGYIWMDSEIHKAAMGQKVFTIHKPEVITLYNGVDYEGFPPEDIFSEEEGLENWFSY